MDIDQAIAIVQKLSDGVDPTTGERLPPSSVYQQADTARALHLALEGLDRLKRVKGRVHSCPPERQGSASAQFAKVLSISAEPKVVCVGNSNIDYTITTAPTGFEYMVSYTPADTSTPGVKEVVATCGSSAATCTVTVVGVELSIDEYLGIDLTDPADDFVSAKATVTITPEDAATNFAWTLIGVALFTNETTALDSAEPDASVREQGVASSNKADVIQVRLQPAELLVETNFTVVKVDIDWPGVAETNEETIGGWVAYNGDDDDTNGVADAKQGAMENGIEDDDLVEIMLTVTPADLPTNETITVSCDGCWLDRQKLTNAAGEYAVGCFPLKVYVEGRTVSQSMRDRAITVTHPSSGARDILKYTVLNVDLDGDSDDDGDVDDDDDAVEATLPVIVAINEDTRELTVRKVGVSSGGTLKIKKTGTGKITLKKPGGITVLGENDAESVDILPDAGTADLVLTLAGTAVGDVDLQLDFASGSFTCADPFKVKVVRSDVVQRSGNTFLAALIGEVRTHSGIDWEKYVTDLYAPGIERISLATYESLADGGPDKKRFRVKKTLYMARRVWAKVYDNMDAQAYTLPTSAHPWNLFTTSTNYNTANCNELVTEQFRRAITEVRGELTKPAQQTAFESTWYSGGAANPLMAGKHLFMFPGKSPTAGPTIFVMQTTLNYRSKCVGATTQLQNDYEGEILIFFYNPYTATRYTAGSSCSICGAGTSYPSAPWHVVPFLELWDEAHHSTITPDSFVGSSFFEEITY